MTNFEKYKDDLMKIEGSFAFDKNTRKIGRCDTEDGIACEDCLFNAGTCFEGDKIQWLCEEYKEPILSDDELELIKAFNKVMGKEYKYVARDTGGLIRFFETKPSIDKSKNYYGHTYIGIQNGKLFPNLKFKDGLYDIENKCFIKK